MKRRGWDVCIMKSAVRRKLAGVLVFMTLAAALALSGCGGADGSYRIEVGGALAEPGVITYLGHTMNVYQDQASNPCGECENQPVSVFVGDSADTVASALADALEKDFGNAEWVLETLGGGALTVSRAGGASSGAPDFPTAPKGLTIRGGFGSDLKTGEAGGSGVDAQVRNIKQFDGTLSVAPLRTERIAAVYGPSYEALVLLGVEDRIVLRADVQTENFPWAEEVFKNIGKTPMLEDVHAAVNMEQLLSHTPDLVYTFPRPNEIATLNKAGVSYIAGQTTRTLPDVKELLRVFASGIGAEAQTRANAYADWFDARLAFVEARTAGLTDAERPKVYYAGTDILTTYGRDSDIIGVIEAAGGAAVSREMEGGSRVRTDAEKLAGWNPDWIFIDHCGMSGSADGTAEQARDRAYAEPKYGRVTAIAAGRVVLTPSGVFYWDMGLQKILLIEYMAKTIHPELFADLDMAAEIQDFYQTFFDYPLTREQAEKILLREAP